MSALGVCIPPSPMYGRMAVPLHCCRTPLETVLHEMSHLGFPVSERSLLKAYLFNHGAVVGDEHRSYDVYNYTTFVEESEALQIDVRLINDRLKELQHLRASLVQQGMFWSLPARDRARYSPKIHRVMWLPVAKAIRMCSPPQQRKWVNSWQAKEWHKWGLDRGREYSAGVLETLWLLQAMGSVEVVRKTCLESLLSRYDPEHLSSQLTRLLSKEVRARLGRELAAFESSHAPSLAIYPSVASPGGLQALHDQDHGARDRSARLTLRSLGLTQVTPSRHAISQVKCLSFNLNILPFGASFFGTGQGRFPKERLEAFVQEVSGRLAWLFALCHCFTVSRQMKKSDVDVVILQEVFATPALPSLCHQRFLIKRLKQLGFEHTVTSQRPTLLSMARRSATSFVPVTSLLTSNHCNCNPVALCFLAFFSFNRRKWTDSGLVIASKFPIIDSSSITFRAAGADLDAGAAKGVLQARVQTEVNQAFDIFNCHLQVCDNCCSIRFFPVLLVDLSTGVTHHLRQVCRHSLCTTA